MRRRSVLAAGAAGAAAVLAGGTSASAAVSSSDGGGQGPRGRCARRDRTVAGSRRADRTSVRDRTDPAGHRDPVVRGHREQPVLVVTPGNGMKWQIVEPEQGVYDWSQADQLVQFAAANGQLVRGHTLAWHNQLPDWLTTGVTTARSAPRSSATLLHDHIITEVSSYRGRIWQWDVCNEFFTRHEPVDDQPERLLGRQPRSGVIADAVHVGAPGGPERAALLQRLQHRRRGRHQRQERRGLRVRPAATQGRRPDPRRRKPGPPGYPVRLEPATAQAGPGAVRQPRPEGRDHRGRRSHVRQQRDRPGADRQPGAIRAALRVLGDAQGGARGAAVHLLHRLGIHRLGLLGSRDLRRRGLRRHVRREPAAQGRLSTPSSPTSRWPPSVRPTASAPTSPAPDGPSPGQAARSR